MISNNKNSNDEPGLGYKPTALKLEEKIREALRESAELTTVVMFKQVMKAIAEGD